MVKLKDVASFVRGITFKPEDVIPVDSVGAVACMRTKNVQEQIDLSDVWGIPRSFVKRSDQFVREGDLLVSTANSWNLVGKCSWVPVLPWPTTVGGFIAALRGGDRIDPRYLYHWFASSDVQVRVRNCARQTTNIANLSFDRCLDLILSLPPLPEQKRVAAILDQADDLRRMRKRALRSLNKLPAITFRDMFGDLVANDSDFEEGTVADLIAGFDTGKNLAPDPDNEDATNRVLKVSAVTSGYFRASEAKPLPDSYAPPLAHFIKRGDLLFSRANTEALIGATALVDEAVSNLVLPDKIWRFKWRGEPEPTFVHHLFQSQPFRREISRRASGTSGSMKNIGKDKVLSILIGLPPKVKRWEFARQVEEYANAGRNARTASAIADALFTSLQHRAFRGDL